MNLIDRKDLHKLGRKLILVEDRGEIQAALLAMKKIIEPGTSDSEIKGATQHIKLFHSRLQRNL